MNSAAYNALICSILRRNYGILKSGAKTLAGIIGVSPRTVQNWLDGTNGPQGAQLIALMSECEELRTEINRRIEERQCQKASLSRSVFVASPLNEETH